MAKAIHTCTGCVPIDASIIEAYVALITMNKNVSDAEDARVEAEASRVLAENARVNAEASRVDVESSRVNAEAARALAENARVEAETARETQAESDHARAGEDHSTAVADHTQAGEDHTASETATDRANAAAASAEHMVDIKQGPKGDQGNTGSSVDYPYELVNNVTTDDPTKGLSAAQGVALDGKISQLGQYVDNPEWVRIVTDANDRILYGVKTDGKFYFGNGCPPQVQEYIQDKISELSLDEYEDIVTFLGDLIDGETLASLLNAKVDKVEGKSLIDAEVASAKSAIDSPEFLDVTLDAENKVLEGIKSDGTKVIGGDLNVGGSTSINGNTKILGNMEVSGVSYNVIENPEYLAAWVDAKNKVIFGLKADGKTYVGDADFLDEIKNNQEAISEIKSYLANFDNLDIDALSYITAIESPEYLKVELDAEDKVLSGTKADGSHYAYNMQSETIDAKVDKEDGKSLIDKEVAESQSIIEDPEGRSEITTDAEGKIISYRDRDGVKHEEVGISIKTLNADTINSANLETIRDYRQALEDSIIYCERPKYGEIWFEGVLPTDLSEDRIPTTLKVKFKSSGVTQFVCYCQLSIQGHGSASYAKKGYTFEPVNENGESLSIKFGDIIETDSFHLKAYATDMLHCRDLGGYAIWKDLVKQSDYPANKINNIPFELATSYNKNKVNIADAFYIPQGFQVGCYLNGEFLGLYTLKLKKTRQNYAMEKSVKSQIFLDSINYHSWLHLGFDYTAWELKNPKLKNYEEGGDIPDAEVKGNIERLFNFLQQIDANVPSTYDNYADYIVLPHWIAFIIIEELTHSIDNIGNNINLMTWDATHWSIVPWDLDLTYGLVGGDLIIRADESYYQQFSLRTTLEGERDFWPFIKTIFETELKTTWTKLRKNGFITEENIASYYKKQIDAIPRDIYASDYNKWGCIWTNGIPSYEQLVQAIHYKITWLDTQWLLNS